MNRLNNDCAIEKMLKKVNNGKLFLRTIHSQQLGITANVFYHRNAELNENLRISRANADFISSC